MPTGWIRVQAVSGGILSVPGVDVELRDGQNQLIAAFATDENGDSAPVRVETPPRELSLQEQNQQLPYSEYNVYARAEGYLPVEILGVQAFEGQTGLTVLQMEPTDLLGTPQAQPQQVNIPEHHLIDPIGQPASVAPTEECPGRILNQVVIPEYITVHLGAPTEYAQNVTVTFKNYIKNVASSEIYPTWPEQALRANIICQISLALNRIYTEWYLSKGYSYQITNSTSYDQYFVYGRNIFENISNLVDELFSTYARKSGSVNPFYTEYCDGNTVWCAGLKQWGTVSLANQGYSALQILRYYYGNEIELVRSTNIAAIPQSYPGSSLSIGSTGQAVRTIQRQLNRIAQNYPSFGTLTVDGVYGSETANVVRNFQGQFSVNRDGIVGYNTWYAINYVYVAVKRLAELSGEGEAPNQDPVSNSTGSWPGNILSIGSTGNAVSRVQYWLDTVRGYISGLPLLAVDGIYGSNTAAAVRVFQTWAGLTADGVVGQATWNALYREFSSVILEEDTELGYVTQYPGTVLRVGSSGQAVRSVQFWLRIISGRYDIPTVAVDGKYGTATATAVQVFQSLFGLSADGAVGSITWNKLRQIFVTVALSLVQGASYPGTYPGYALRRGSTGTAVREMQYYLYVLSLYYPSIPPVSYDGIFGAATQQAVIAFQTLIGLIADGVVGSATWSALYAAYVRIITVEGASRSGDSPALTGELEEQKEGEDVLRLQESLQFISQFYQTVQNPISPEEVWVQPVIPEPNDAYDIPGEYGEYTANAVASFQATFGLPVTGRLDEQTRKAVMAIFDAANAEDIYGEQDTVIAGEYPGVVLGKGAHGPLVSNLQQQTNRTAAELCGVSYAAQDGVFRLQTEHTVKQVQDSSGLPVSGAVTRDTWAVLQHCANHAETQNCSACCVPAEKERK